MASPKTPQKGFTTQFWIELLIETVKALVTSQMLSEKAQQEQCTFVPTFPTINTPKLSETINNEQFNLPGTIDEPWESLGVGHVW